MKKLLLVLLAMMALQGVAAAAAVKNAPIAPDPAANPVLAKIQQEKAQLFYLGNRGGLDGWFIVKDQQVQIAYATPDNKGAVIGALFAGSDGQNVTAQQVADLVRTNKEVGDMVKAAETAAAAQAPATSSAPTAALSPGERLMRELAAASDVVVGNAASPEILMVMDPHCLHCQATWKMIRDAVFKGSVHLRMIPIDAMNSDGERAAAVLLGASDPLNTWDKYAAGDRAQLAGTPPESALAAIRANHLLIDRWSISQTPWLVYRAKDGTVKIVQGEPDDISALLSDLGT